MWEMLAWPPTRPKLKAGKLAPIPIGVTYLIVRDSGERVWGFRFTASRRRLLRCQCAASSNNHPKRRRGGQSSSRLLSSQGVPSKLGCQCHASRVPDFSSQVDFICKCPYIYPSICTAFASLGRKHRFCGRILRHALDARNEAALQIYRRTGNLRAVQLLLGNQHRFPPASLRSNDAPCYALVSRQVRADVRQASAATPMARP